MLRLEIFTSAHDSMIFEYAENTKGMLSFRQKLMQYTRDINKTKDIEDKSIKLKTTDSKNFDLAPNIKCRITKVKKASGCEKESDKLTYGRTSYGDYCRFCTGQTYMGYREDTKEIMSVIITKKTPQFVFYETDTGLTGKAIVKFLGGNEAILIKKANNLIVNSANKWN